MANLEDEDAWQTIMQGAKYGAPQGSRAAAIQGLAKLAKRFEHLKPEAIEIFKKIAEETRGTPAATFRGKLAAIQSMGMLEDLTAIPILRKLSTRETDGRLKRRADDTISELFESAKKPKEMILIRSDLDDLIKQNKSLRDRFNLMENREEAKSKKKKRT